jgi:hypothetical protein
MRVEDDGQAALVTLVYELLDAHDDTACLAAQLADDPAWSHHLDYLHRLQRVGRETLAACCDQTIAR